MTIRMADQLKANAPPAENYKRWSQESSELKQVYTDMLLREITARATERIVRRAWERYANSGQVPSATFLSGVSQRP